MNKEALILIRSANLSALDTRQRKILELRAGLDGPPITLEEIGKKFGISRERTRQIQNKALGKLRAKT
jgi:RNA polymerase primary sigma factor